MASKRPRRRRGVFRVGEPPQTTYTYGRRIAKKWGLTITSIYRTPAHNAAIGGAPGSWHTKGYAVDFVPRNGDWTRLDKLAIWLRLKASRKLVEGPIWRSAGHYDHLHLAFKPGKAKPSKKQI